MLGTWVNTLAVIIGSLMGIVLKDKFPEKIKNAVFQGIGLVTLFMGLQMSLQTNNLLIMIFSISIGAIIGESLNIEARLRRVAIFFESKTNSKDSRFVEGMVTAFLIFCIGSMTITGAIEDGINNNPSILFAKSTLDFFTSVSLATVFGLGVLFSALPLLIFQGGITLLASYSNNFFNELVIQELSGVGGILLLGLGITILDIKEIKVANLLPSLIIAPLLIIIL
jgi:hypothetical protein